MVLLIDNYDSFVYNLYQYIGELGEKIVVYRNDKIKIEEIKKIAPSRIIISPGPGRPENAGVSCEIIEKFAGQIPILGVCLGHQCIGYVFGGKIIGAKKLMHGKTSQIYHKGKNIYKNLKNPFQATRYHSLIIEKKSIPSVLEIDAWSEDEEIMGIRHKNYKIYGVQFHPESILTEEGKKLIKNFLDI
ncbi:MAG TPA: aminodeoxychorismate/anthranilate synthase component II [Candidatus Ratteibacteria bacterium]|nr:aminodeoxychorismate/anthranilate synthase component II [Candidatus Ratteibacteria bacterium]